MKILRPYNVRPRVKLASANFNRVERRSILFWVFMKLTDFFFTSSVPLNCLLASRILLQAVLTIVNRSHCTRVSPVCSPPVSSFESLVSSAFLRSSSFSRLASSLFCRLRCTSSAPCGRLFSLSLSLSLSFSLSFLSPLSRPRGQALVFFCVYAPRVCVHRP